MDEFALVPVFEDPRRCGGTVGTIGTELDGAVDARNVEAG